jgi:L-threonylcarbamoyladenylate synthase
LEDLDGRIDCILQGEATEVGLESTVVDCTGEIPLILRSGAVTLEQLREVVPETKLSQVDSADAPKSPGLKHKHYSPEARVVLIDDPARSTVDWQNAYIGLVAPAQIEDYGLAKICHSVPEYAHTVFEFFRECDRLQIKTIFCQKLAPEGLAAALMDRLERAAQS